MPCPLGAGDIGDIAKRTCMKGPLSSAGLQVDISNSVDAMLRTKFNYNKGQ